VDGAVPVLVDVDAGDVSGIGCDFCGSRAGRERSWGGFSSGIGERVGEGGFG
jgi:hypothetical protein